MIDLEIAAGKIDALVSGSDIYTLTITIETLPRKAWQAIQSDCARSITSLIDLLQGRFDRGVMERLTRKEGGLFPKPKEIRMQCNCPDIAGMCKHLAAVMYGVGARLDRSPELFFTLRNVDHLELIDQAVSAENLDQAFAGDGAESIHADDLSQMFGIELESGSDLSADSPPAPKSRRRSPSAPKPMGATMPRKGRPAAAKKPARNAPAPIATRASVKAKASETASVAPRTTRKSPAKPASPAAGKSIAKTPAKPASKATAKSSSKATAKSSSKTTAKSSSKTQAKPASKAAVKTRKRPAATGPNKSARRRQK